ncbi:MAG: hypothetical protein Q4F80_00230 [bacterium]|nr:hypothetical protein [bacterium]
MKILTGTFFMTGFIFLLSLLIGGIFIFTKNGSLRLKSAYSIFLAGCMILYLASVFCLFAGSIVTGNSIYAPYIIFAFMPFLIGKISNYKRLKFYTALQIAVLLAGCISSFCLLVAC